MESAEESGLDLCAQTLGRQVTHLGHYKRRNNKIEVSPLQYVEGPAVIAVVDIKRRVERPCVNDCDQLDSRLSILSPRFLPRP